MSVGPITIDSPKMNSSSFSADQTQQKPRKQSETFDPNCLPDELRDADGVFRPQPRAEKSSRCNEDICSTGQRSSRRAARRNCVAVKPSESEYSVSGVTWPAGRGVKKRLQTAKAANSNLKRELWRVPVSGTPALRPGSRCCPAHSQRHSPAHLSCSLCWPSP